MKYFLISLLFSLSIHAAIEDHNFGIVAENSKYQIYRSQALGSYGVSDVWNYLKKNNLPTPKTVIYMNDEGYKKSFFQDDFALQQYKIQEQFGFKFFHSYDYKYRTYVDGHDPLNPSEDIDLKGNLNSEAVKLFGPNPKDGIDGGEAAVIRVLDLILDPANQPVLFHCLGGKHRTGMIGMILRYIQSDAALEKVSNDSLYKTRAEVEYLKFAGSSAREENVIFVRKFIQSDKFKEYKSRFRGLL